MADRLLNQPFETSGEWYLPDAPDRKIAGILQYTSEHTELHLHERFIPLRSGSLIDQSGQTYPIVHGISRDGEAITLLNVQQVGWSVHSGSGGVRFPERLISSIALIGAHVPQAFAYRELDFRVPGLQIWLSRPSIERSFGREEKNGNLMFSYRVRAGDKESIRVPSIDSYLDWYLSAQSNSDLYSSISLVVSAWVTIRPDTPKSLDWYFEQVGKVTPMLAFLAGSPMSPDCIRVFFDQPLQDVYAMVALRDAGYCHFTNLHEFFMPRGEMGIDLGDVVSRWFEIYPKLHMPIQLAFSVLSSEKLWRHVEFLSLMQALEGFHRSLFIGEYMGKEDYRPVKNALEDAIPAGLSPNHKEALRSRIRYGYQFSLGTRLDDLERTLPEQIRTIILGEAGNIPRSWVDTRNYYTHWDEELRSNVLSPRDMYYANLRMRHFLRALYLNLNPAIRAKNVMR